MLVPCVCVSAWGERNFLIAFSVLLPPVWWGALSRQTAWLVPRQRRQDGAHNHADGRTPLRIPACAHGNGRGCSHNATRNAHARNVENTHFFQLFRIRIRQTRIFPTWIRTHPILHQFERQLHRRGRRRRTTIQHPHPFFIAARIAHDLTQKYAHTHSSLYAYVQVIYKHIGV